MMETLPKSVTAFLRDDKDGQRCCSECRASLTSSETSVVCCECGLCCYCSATCKSNHWRIHRRRCDEFRFFTSDVSPRFSRFSRLKCKINRGDRLVRMGFHCNHQTENRSLCFKKALRMYLEGISIDNVFANVRFGTRAEDRVLLLLVFLGGDAQVLLDWLSFTSPEQADEDEDTAENPPSAESEQMIKYPLLALHGLLEKDTHDPETCTLANLYLLASCRSLAEHRRKKASFQAYQSVIQQGEANSKLPARLASVHCHVAAFLWGQGQFEYGEALAEEIPRVIQHIKDYKRGGTAFLQYACDESANFSPREAPNLLTNGDAAYMELQAPISLTEVPELWLLYQECFLAMMPDLDVLKEFLAVDEDLECKKKKD